MVDPEFLKPRSHGHATGQKISDFAQNFEICMRKLEICAFYIFFFTHILGDFSDIFAFLLAQNFKTKLLTAQKKSTFRVSG